MREQLASMCAADGNRVAVTILMMSPLDDLYAKKNGSGPKSGRSAADERGSTPISSTNKSTSIRG